MDKNNSLEVFVRLFVRIADEIDDKSIRITKLGLVLLLLRYR